MEKGKAKLVDSPADKRYEVCVGPMQEDEKQYLLRKGLLFEDSRGEFFEKSTFLDETMDSVAEGDLESSRKADNGNVEVLFHIGDICVGPPMPPGSIIPDIQPKSGEISISGDVLEVAGARLVEGRNVSFSDLNDENECIDKENVPPVFNYVNTGIGIDMQDAQKTQDLNSTNPLDEYSTPETSYCQVTPPIITFDTPPALNPESQNSFEYFEEALSGSELESEQHLSRASVSGEDLDDTLSQMEKLLALADAQESEELKNAQDARTATLKEVKPILNKTSATPQSMYLSQDNEVMFKTPYAPPSSKKGAQSSRRVNYASPVEREIISKPMWVTNKTAASTPKSATRRDINSLLVSPISTIRGSPTPHAAEKFPAPKPVRAIPIPIQKKITGPSAETPVGLPGKRPVKLANLMPVNSPVARYIYSTPPPAMVKRAVKTECGPQDKKQPWRLNKPVEPLPKSGAGSGIPRLQSLSNSHNVSKLSESMYDKKLTALNEGLGKKAYQGKQLKSVAYQGSTPSSQERVFGNDADDYVSTPVSTPIVDVASASREHFISQRHTGLRNVNTNESIVQHSSVDKKFIPVRIFGTQHAQK